MKLESNIYSNQNNNIVMRTMKHFLSLLLLLVINIHAYASDDGVIRILAIGNSFSQDAIENYLHQLAEASGKQTIIANMYIGGCTLERHYNNARNNTAAYSYRKIGVDGKKGRCYLRNSIERRKVGLCQFTARQSVVWSV